MKQATIQFKIDLDKYSALQRYAVKKEISIENELTETVDKLYKKLVPADVREFIEETETVEQPKKEKKNRENRVSTNDAVQENTL